MKRNTWQVWPVGLAFVPAVAVLILGAGAAVRAQGEQGRPGVESIPADAAVLEMSLPPGASVSIDGVPQGARRRVEFRPFPAGTLGRYEVKVRFPDGVEVSHSVLLQRGWMVRLPVTKSVAPRPEIVVQTGHTDSVFSVAFSPDGRRIVTGSQDSTAILWDAGTGMKIRSLTGHSKWITSVAFSPDGRRVLTGSGETAILCDAETGAKLRTLDGGSRMITSVAFSPDGRRALTGSEDKTAILWDTETGAKLRTFSGHTQGVTSVAFSPDGRRMLTGSQDSTAILWDTKTGAILRTLSGHTDWVYSVAFSPDGRRALIGGGLWGGTATLCDAETGAKLLTLLAEPLSSIYSVAFSSDGRRFLTGSSDVTAILWSSETGAKLRTLAGHPTIDEKVAFSPDGRQILTGLWDGTATLWDAETGAKLRTLDGGSRMDSSVAFSPDGRRALTGAGGKSANLWDVETGAKLRTFSGQTGWISSMAFSPDGRRALTGSGLTAILWDAETGAKLRKFFGHTQGVTSVAFSPDGRRALTGSEDDTAILWDTETGAILRALSGHTSSIKSVAFSPDGRRALTGSRDSTAILWDTETGAKLHTLAGHSVYVTSVAFSPDGRRALTGSMDGTTRLWDLATGEELAALICVTAGEGWLVTTPEGLFDGSEGGRQKVAYRVGGLNVVPVDRFFQDFYHPGLLAELFRGERPRPEVDLARSRPPLIRIVSPRARATVEADSVTVDVEVEDQGGGIRGPQLFQNGVRVLAPGATERQGKVLKRRFDIGLVEGKNLIEVRDACGDGSQESEPAGLTLRYEKPLNKGDLYVLSVGINHYAQESMDLKFAAADARAIAAVFRQRGEALYRKTVVTELVDGGATRAAIRGALREIARAARPQDTLVVFLAGHGTMVGQRFYFIPHDFRIDPGAPQAESVQRLGLPADVLADDLSAVRALRRLMVLDACQSGGALATGRSRDPFAMRGAIERIARSQGLFTIAASVAGDEAHEVPELGHGVLSYALLEGLGAADQGPLKGESMRPGNPERVADVIEWFSYAAGQLPRLTKRYLVQFQG